MRTKHSAVIEPAVPVRDRSAPTDTKNDGPVATQSLAARKLRLIWAVTMLDSLFEEAISRANTARARAGWPSLIAVRKQIGERCYYAPGQQGIELTLSLSVSVPLHYGELFGGVYIKPGGAQSAIYLVPAIDNDPVYWRVQVTGSMFTSTIADDLFRATFSEDPDAARRLAPLYGFDLFATPWS